MLRKSLHIQALPPSIIPWDRRRCKWISHCVFFQCIIVYIGSATILECVWSPDTATSDFNKLARIMYLYDHSACGYRLKTATALTNIQLPNETYGLNILPIRWKQAVVTVSTRLSSKTRRYIEFSLAVHVIWNVCAIIMYLIIGSKSNNHRVLKYTLSGYFYYSVFVIIFDISMAIVYIAHIQQSLTKGMVLRYSGWSVELKLESYEDFAGWLPMIASALWMRGILFLIWNIYCTKIVNGIRRKMYQRLVRIKVRDQSYYPIPEPKLRYSSDTSVLYYRTGEQKPFVKTDASSQVFYHQ
ncbi:hypothetical protein ABMA28_002950 [Loxostege sticticalis]|uniref:Gustatory receptor n=1 Tax=Loxostege sticticalis TaxID=481309 RepID=A0ABD0T177_LOXSC